MDKKTAITRLAAQRFVEEGRKIIQMPPQNVVEMCERIYAQEAALKLAREAIDASECVLVSINQSRLISGIRRKCKDALAAIDEITGEGE